ncbi:hypothetical protein PROFUN_08582 [Planoprotostelium fungivorum]|uniref:Glutamate synthase central-N domain-containing protein n=1 Tax=Planoprotostelium fungivorum TaxID=1890364 RepID=A0A2P6N1R4_9EUKA|nr:hypothetical protein PROFUN_08582 [Planoprotostelium fungivorum]
MLSSIQMHAVHNLHLYDPQWRSCSIDITFPREEGEEGYVKALDRICREGQNSVEEGHRIIVLSDRNTSFQRVPLSTLVACGAVHHHLQRLKIVLVVETAEAREVHHMCVLLGYGADAICPYLVHDLIGKLHRDNAVPALNMSAEQMIHNYSDVTTVMSKMGISTLQSYKGAQIFEALGLDDTIVKRCFKGTATRIRGSTFYTLACDALAFHEYGYPTLDQSIEPTNTPDKTAYNLREAGEYHYRIGGKTTSDTLLSIVVKPVDKRQSSDRLLIVLRVALVEVLKEAGEDASHDIPAEDVFHLVLLALVRVVGFCRFAILVVLRDLVRWPARPIAPQKHSRT